MTRQRTALILQAVGSDAALLRAGHAPGGAARLEPLGQWTAAAPLPRDATCLVDAAVRDGIRACVHAARLYGHDVTLVVATGGVSCHRVVLPNLPRDAVAKALRLKLANLIHYEVNSAIVATDDGSPVVHATPPARSYRVAAARHDVAASACAAVEQAGLRPVRLVSATAALDALVETHAAGDAHPAATAFVGESQTVVLLHRAGTMLLCNELPIALADLTAALTRPIIDGARAISLDPADARAVRDRSGIPAVGETVFGPDVQAERVLPLIEPVLQQWSRHLTQWLSFAAATDNQPRIGCLALCGPGAELPGLAESLSTRLGVMVQVAATVRNAVLETLHVPLDAPRDEILRAAALAPAVAAQRHGAALPMLLPPDRRRLYRMEAAARALSIAGPTIAAALLIFALLLWRIHGDLAATAAADELALAQVQVRIRQSQRWQILADHVQQAEQELAAFRSAAPRWTGLFKELARLLPAPVALRQLELHSQPDGLELRLSSHVHVAGVPRGFDGIIQDTLLALQRSCFLERVAVVSAGKTAAAATGSADAGNLLLATRLAYPCADAGAAAPSATTPVGGQ